MLAIVSLRKRELVALLLVLLDLCACLCSSVIGWFEFCDIVTFSGYTQPYIRCLDVKCLLGTHLLVFTDFVIDFDDLSYCGNHFISIVFFTCIL